MNLAVAVRRRPRLGRIVAASSVAGAALTCVIIAARLDGLATVAARARTPHLPDLTLFVAQPPVVQAHVLAALAAVGLGAAMMLSRKGKRFHRVGGWAWSALMVTVALSSLFIVGLNGGRWSFLHLFSGWVLVFLPLAVLAARRHVVVPHRLLMMTLFYGSLLITGALTFLPGRLMWRLFFG